MVVFSLKAGAAAAWDRRVEGKTLTFEPLSGSKKKLFKDKETGSSWEPMSGICIDGKLKGKTLKPLIGIAIRLDRWRGFYPKGDVYR